MDSASTDGLTRFWIGLPEELKAELRLGFSGKAHLYSIVGCCIRLADPALTPILKDALGTLIRDNPLDGDMARDLLNLAPARALLAPDTVSQLTTLADNYRRPTDLNEYFALRSPQKVQSYIRTQIKQEPGNLFWKEQKRIVELSHFDTLKDANQQEFDPKNVKTTPWNTGQILRAYDQLKNIPDQRTPIPGTTAVLLYSWNKCGELGETLASLLESDLTGASVFVLDNGSSDGTADMLREWEPRFADRLGPGRFSIVSLPVNIGAAPARNWLMHMDAVRAQDFICYLDDDVELPTDWLTRLGAAVDIYPDAGVWGCKVVDHANPQCIQSADSHLLPSELPGMDLSAMSPHPFSLSTLHTQTLDTGVFDFIRPCASVTGCCHLFRTSTLLESGDFAIQLSPSQYDDMEHDLRLCEAGLFPVYQGHLTVRHKKSTGAASRTSMQEEGNALGNRYKMQTMHDPDAIHAAVQAEQKRLDRDLMEKMAWLDKNI